MITKCRLAMALVVAASLAVSTGRSAAADPTNSTYTVGDSTFAGSDQSPLATDLATVMPSTTAHSVAGRPESALPAHVRLPRDESTHRVPTEWWYFNGHLSAVDAQGRRHRYGFEYVTFKFEGSTPQPLYVANYAVTDLTRRAFAYSARTDSYPRSDLRNAFDLHTAGWSMRGSGGRYALHAQLSGYALRLRTVPTGPATLHGEDGVIPFRPFGRSAYYSRTSLSAAGTLVDHGVRLHVTGMSWMDHQWGPFDFSSGGGWDWFSIQLRDGQRYMLYFLRAPSGRVIDTVGTEITSAGRSVPLRTSTFAEQATGTWTSPATAITYSSGWRLHVPGGQLVVRPQLRDQEVDVRAVQGVSYWEGDVAIHGSVDGQRVTGVGYTEINPVATEDQGETT